MTQRKLGKEMVPAFLGQVDHNQPATLALPIGLVDTDAERIAAALDHSQADNTRRTYAGQWRAFDAWAGGRGVSALVNARIV